MEGTKSSIGKQIVEDLIKDKSSNLQQVLWFSIRASLTRAGLSSKALSSAIQKFEKTSTAPSLEEMEALVNSLKPQLKKMLLFQIKCSVLVDLVSRDRFLAHVGANSFESIGGLRDHNGESINKPWDIDGKTALEREEIYLRFFLDNLARSVFEKNSLNI